MYGYRLLYLIGDRDDDGNDDDIFDGSGNDLLLVMIDFDNDCLMPKYDKYYHDKLMIVILNMMICLWW